MGNPDDMTEHEMRHMLTRMTDKQRQWIGRWLSRRGYSGQLALGVEGLEEFAYILRMEEISRVNTFRLVRESQDGVLSGRFSVYFVGHHKKKESL